MSRRVNKGTTRCGGCLKLGHNRRTCPTPRKRGVSRLYYAPNDGYHHNRAHGLCDDCGRKWKRTTRCPECTWRRNTRPSRLDPAKKRLEQHQRRVREALRLVASMPGVASRARLRAALARFKAEFPDRLDAYLARFAP